MADSLFFKPYVLEAHSPIRSDTITSLNPGKGYYLIPRASHTGIPLYFAVISLLTLSIIIIGTYIYLKKRNKT